MAYSVDNKVKILTNVGARKKADGSFTIVFAGQDASGNRFLMQAETANNATTWKYKTRSWAYNLGADFRLGAGVDLSTFLDTQTTDFVDSGNIPDVNVSNDSGNKLKSTTNVEGNIPHFSLLGDGITSNPFAVVDSVYTPPTKTTASSVPTGVFGAIGDFISQNPLTSTAIAVGVALLALWAWDEYKDSNKSKKKKR